MKEKLQILIQSEKLTPSELARKLDVNPPVISHILKGRNQPSYELIRKIITRFPQINPYWLLGDSDTMYNNTSEIRPNQSEETQHELFPSSAEWIDEMVSKSDKNEVSAVHESPACNNGHPTASEIDRIIITYKNGTFESLVPKQ